MRSPILLPPTPRLAGEFAAFKGGGVEVEVALGGCCMNRTIPKDTLFYLKTIQRAGEGDVAVVEPGVEQAGQWGITIGELLATNGLLPDIELLFGPGHIGLA